MLGRCRRRVLVVGDDTPRNGAAVATHGFFTRDGAAPWALLEASHTELAKYQTVHVERATVIAAVGTRGAFTVTCTDDRTFTGRRLLIATGVVDKLPEIAGIDALYGRSVHHCPFCDAFEYAGRPLAQYGRGHDGVEAAVLLRSWTDDVVLITHGETLSPQHRERCRACGVGVREEVVSRLVGQAGVLQRIEFAGGGSLERAALFFSTSQRQRSDLAKDFGCEINSEGTVVTKEYETTNVPGVYVAGDASHRGQKLVIAAAEGALAAMKIHESLWTEDLETADRAGGASATTSQRSSSQR